MVHPGMVTGSHGYPRAPSTTATHSSPGTGPVGLQQPQLGSQCGVQVRVASMNGSMQHQQGGFPGLSCLCVCAMPCGSYSMPSASCGTRFVPVALQTSMCAICCLSVGFVFPLPAVPKLGGRLHLPFCCLGWSYTRTAVPILLHQAHLGGSASNSVTTVHTPTNQISGSLLCCSVICTIIITCPGWYCTHPPCTPSFGTHQLLVHVSFCASSNLCQSCRQCVATSDQQWQRDCH